MKTTKGVNRQLLELLKIYVISVIPWLLMGLSSIFNSNGVPGLVLVALVTPFSIVYALIACFPLSVIWLVWLLVAHYKAVQTKFKLGGGVSSSKVVRFLLNRPLILLVGLLVFLPPAFMGNPYVAIYAAYFEIGYLVYLLLPNIRRLWANA